MWCIDATATVTIGGGQVTVFAADGLQFRYDHGSQFMSDDFQNEGQRCSLPDRGRRSAPIRCPENVSNASSKRSRNNCSWSSTSNRSRIGSRSLETSVRLHAALFDRAPLIESSRLKGLERRPLSTILRPRTNPPRGSVAVVRDSLENGEIRKTVRRSGAQQATHRKRGQSHRPHSSART